MSNNTKQINKKEKNLFVYYIYTLKAFVSYANFLFYVNAIIPNTTWINIDYLQSHTLGG